MREFLSSGQIGNIELNEQKKIRTEIKNRWESLGFVDGLNGALKENVALLYENEAKHLLTEATDANNSGSFQTVVFPIIRRVFSKLLANDIVSVQAMTMPSGLLFFMKPITSQREWEGFNADGSIPDSGVTGSHKGLMGYDRVNRNKLGSIEPRYYLPDEVINGITGQYEVLGSTAVTNTYDTFALAKAAAVAEGIDPSNIRKVGPEVVDYFEKSLYDLFYDDFLFDNSKGKVTINVGTANVVELTANGFVSFTGTLNTYKQAGDGSIRSIMLAVKGFSSVNAGRLTGPDGNEMDTESFLASMKVLTKKAIASGVIGTSGATTSAFDQYESVPFRVVTQKYGKGIVDYNNPCDANGTMYIELDLTKPVSKREDTIDGYVGVLPASISGASNDFFQIAWAQYDSLELETEIGEVSFNLDRVAVTVEERKLRATWSPELAQDVAAYQNIDAEAELTALLSEQIGAELDREILRDLRKDAPWQARWDYNGWRRQAAFSTNYTQKDWNQMLFTTVNQVDAQIQKATLRGGANFLVVSAEISAVFNDLEYFHVTDASSESDQYNMGIEKIGSLNNRYQVYRDPYAPYWSMIIGHKGKSLLDTGYIYAPYVPMQLTPTAINPFNFAPVKGIMTRYAKKTVNNRFYGHVKVDGLKHWSTTELR